MKGQKVFVQVSVPAMVDVNSAVRYLRTDIWS